MLEVYSEKLDATIIILSKEKIIKSFDAFYKHYIKKYDEVLDQNEIKKCCHIIKK